MRATEAVVRFFSCPNSRPKKVRGSPPRSRTCATAAEQHAARPAGRVVDRLALLRVEDVHHQPHHAARGVELAGLVVGGVGELLDQVLVGVADDVAGARAGCPAARPRSARSGP